MEKDQVEKIGRYQILGAIGKGGMGEVLRAYDPVCEREVAIKRIRKDIKHHSNLTKRFLREAKITAQLTHPGIVSIYSIHQEEDALYYVMPHIHGETLKQILKSAHQGKSEAPIVSLLPIFRTLCQTISYVHSKGIVHRDIKPENILVGEFGEVIILDWGIAMHLTDDEDEMEIIGEEGLTSPGKMVGTVAYMPPERAHGGKVNFSLDIYALGVMLYQILTLHFPFKRASVKEFRKTSHLEKLLDPEEIAPYREVPPRLSRIVKRTLDPNPDERYTSVEELLDDLNSHMEGTSEWFESATLDIHNKKDWLFQENVLISQYVALTRTTEEAAWVSIMVSKNTFPDNVRIETRFRLEEESGGIGFLLSVPEMEMRETPMEGYCLWMSGSFSKFFRSTVEVMHLPDLALKEGVWHTLRIERSGSTLHFTIDAQLRFTYVSYLPLFGSHVGFVSRDEKFSVDPFTISVGSQELHVSCLSVPDAFLASKDYKRALAEYRRIGASFPGHREGREALFRAGITLLEKAKTAKKGEKLYATALEEFSKLRKTPLEYLGKSLVYKALRDHTEEIKCLELGLRRYNKHPLVDSLREQICYRMHEASQVDRRSAYQLILIALRLLPEVISKPDTVCLLSYLVKHWEQLPFIDTPIDLKSLTEEIAPFAVPLAFWLATPYTLLELVPKCSDSSLSDLIFCLFEIGSYGLAEKLLQEKQFEGKEHFTPLLTGEATYETPLRILCYLMRQAIKNDEEEKVYALAKFVESTPLSKEERIRIDACCIWALLKEGRWAEAGALFDNYPIEMLAQESTELYPLYGCWLYETEGEEIALLFFQGVIDTPFPRTWALLGHELTNNILDNPSWFSTSFLWERRLLYQQLTLYYTIAENPELEAYYRELEKKEYIYVAE
ncbi:MAG: protein kinase [Chlamydiales bacterium]|nr:protein kinase [Chlamydiales bacterium]